MYFGGIIYLLIVDRSSDSYSEPTMLFNYTIYCRSKHQDLFFTSPYTIRRRKQAMKGDVGKLFPALLAGVTKATHVSNRLE